MQDRCFAPLDWTDPPRTRSARLSLRGFLHNSRGGGGRKRGRRGGGKRRKKWMDLVLLFFCCESRRISPPHSWKEMAVDISESFSTSRVDERSSSYFIDEHMKTQPGPTSFFSILFLPALLEKCRHDTLEPFTRFPNDNVSLHDRVLLFIYLFPFFYRGILLAERIINWWVNQIVRMHALTPVYNYRN